MEFAVATMVKMGPVMPQMSARPKEEVPKDHVHQDTDHAAFVRGKINLRIRVPLQYVCPVSNNLLEQEIQSHLSLDAE